MNASTDQEDNAGSMASPATGVGSFKDVDQHLKDWVGKLLSGKGVSLSAPVDLISEPQVCLYLLEIHPLPPLPGIVRNKPLQFRLGYLVTTSAERPEDAHAMLWTLAFAAMEEQEFEVEIAPLSGELWQAFGAAPRPSFMLRVPLRLERPEPKPALVQSAMEIQSSPTRSLEGVLQGPGGVPIPNARVEVPAFHVASNTDHRGRFRFAVLPSNLTAHRFRIQARGHEYAVEVEYKVGGPEPLVIQINPGDA